MWNKQNQKLTWVHREQLNEEKGRETKEKLILKKKKIVKHKLKCSAQCSLNQGYRKRYNLTDKFL